MALEDKISEVLLVIPARGGSKRIPNKNIVQLAGKPLIAYSIEQAKSSKLVNRIIVSTDDKTIMRISENYGAEVIIRPKEISGDTTSSESAILHVLDYLKKKENYEPGLVVFLQCTSPVRQQNDIDNAIKLLMQEKADSLFSACKNDKLIWALNKNEPRALNYDYKNRKREQDFPNQFRENGSIYIFKTQIIKKSKNRLDGKIIIYEMGFWSSFQVDSLEDLELMEWIIKNKVKYL